MGASRDASQEVSGSPQGPQKTSKKQNCSGGKKDGRNLTRVQTQPAEPRARSKRKRQMLAISLE